MKRLVALVAGSIFLVGLPLVMIVTGMTPTTVASGFIDSINLRNPTQLGTHAGLLGLWSTWAWGCGSVLFDIVRTWSLRHDQPVSAMSSRYSLLFVIALWSILFASKPSPAVARSVEIEHVVGAEILKQDVSDGQLGIAIGGSAVFIFGVLTHVNFLRLRQLQLAPAGSYLPPMSQRAAFTWSEMRHREQPQQTQCLLSAIDALKTSESRAQLVAVNERWETRALSDFQDAIQSPFGYIPIGISKNETVVLAVAPGSRFDIVAHDIDQAMTAARHLIAVAQLSDNSKDINVIVDSGSILDALQIAHDVSQDRSRDAEWLESCGKIRIVVDASTDPFAPEIVVSPDEAVIKICVVSNHANRMQLNASGWVLLPLGQHLSVFGLTEFETSALADLITESSKPVLSDKRHADPLLTDWNVCVRLLGPVDAETRRGEPIGFEKSKSLELLAWLTTHRERPTRIAARTALWEISIQDATFNNVVSGLRRGLASGSDLEYDIELLPKTFNDYLLLHGSVVTDVEVLNDAVNGVKKRGDRESWFQLHDALDRVRDLPFIGTDYLWPDSEGITSNFILTVITGSIMAAENALYQGDIEGVFWATGQGLKVLHGHEELVALRMRAYGEVGDRAGVNAEWSSYERSLLHDSWSGGSPSPRIVELRRELIG
jgi:hypothetical protein